MGDVRPVEQGASIHDSLQIVPEKVGKNEGRSYSCECSKKRIVGLIALVCASVLLIIAGILASGVLGGGKMAFVAGGLVIGSMCGFGVAAFLLMSRYENPIHT